MNSKRGQLSLETMIIYGLIILVTLSVIGGLIYFKILDLSAYLPDSCDLGGTTDLKCEEWKFTSTGELSLGIRNIGSKPVEYLTISVEDAEGVHFSGVKGPVTVDTFDGAEALSPGDITEVTINCGAAEGGKVFRGLLTTNYMFREGAIDLESKGTLRTKASR